MALELPYGPWSQIFSGDWSGYTVSLYENPDKLTLTMVFDKRGGEVRGIVLYLNKYFTVEGDISRFAASVGKYSLVMEKHQPTGRIKFFSLSSGPRYVKPDQDSITEGIEEAYKVLEKDSEAIMGMSRGYSISLVELKHAKEDAAARLFAEPMLLPGLVIRKAVEAAPPRIGAKVALGKKASGEMAEENIQSFSATVAVGKGEALRDLQHVIAEGALLAGATTLIFDEGRDYEKMDQPNREFDFEAYPELQPVGMPLKGITLGKEAGIDLNLLSARMLRSIIGLEERGDKYRGKEASDLMDSALESARGGIKSLSDLEEKLLAVKDEAKKFHIYRAVRFVRVLQRAHGGTFGGKADIRSLITPYLRTMGSALRIDLADTDGQIRKGLVYTMLKSIYGHYKAELATREIKVLAIIQGAEKYVPAKAADPLQAGIKEVLADCNSYGLGFSLGCEHDIDLDPEVLKANTMRLELLPGGEVAVKEVNSRPYRITVRPPLSAR